MLLERGQRGTLTRQNGLFGCAWYVVLGHCHHGPTTHIDNRKPRSNCGKYSDEGGGKCLIKTPRTTARCSMRG